MGEKSWGDARSEYWLTAASGLLGSTKNINLFNPLTEKGPSKGRIQFPELKTSEIPPDWSNCNPELRFPTRPMVMSGPQNIVPVGVAEMFGVGLGVMEKTGRVPVEV